MARDPGRILIILGFTLTSLSTILVSLRLYVRQVQVHRAGLADYTMVVALLSVWACSAVNYFQTTFGKEYYLLGLEVDDPLSPVLQEPLSGTLVTWFIYRPLYILSLSLVKLSILFFYRSLAPSSTSQRSFRPFRWTVNTLIVLMVCYTLAMILASILQCSPISAAYSNWAFLSMIDKTLPKPTCFDPTDLFAFSAVFNFATDAIILLLPVPIVLSLRSMSRGKRLAVFAVLSLGMLTTAASAIRMYILVLWSKDVHSQTKYGTDMLIWGQVEVNCGILGACAPILRPLFRRCVEGRRKPGLGDGLGSPLDGGRRIEAIRTNVSWISEASFADSQTVITMGSVVHAEREHQNVLPRA